MIIPYSQSVCKPEIIAITVFYFFVKIGVQWAIKIQENLIFMIPYSKFFISRAFLMSVYKNRSWIGILLIIFKSTSNPSPKL